MNNIIITANGLTKTIEQWGFTYCTLTQVSRAASILILDSAGGDPTLPALIPYAATIEVQIEMGDGSVQIWKGRQRKFNARAFPDAPRTSMQFEDVWSDLALRTFQHYWSMGNGEGGLVNTFWSNLMLFQDISAGPDSNWAYLTADNQIRQIVQFAQNVLGVQVQCGEVDPVWNMPIMNIKAVSCAEALQVILQPMPDTVTQVDATTTPPTINFKQRANCTPIYLPFGGTDAQGRSHISSEITPRPDLQVPSVNIQYSITGNYNGSAYNDPAYDNYPLGSQGTAEGAIIFPCNLRGPSNSILAVNIKTVAIDPTTTDFWLTNKQDLNDPNITSLSIVNTAINTGSDTDDSISIKDGAGNYVSLASYPNKLLPSGGQVASWMKGAAGAQIEGIPVTITATLKYTKKNPVTGTTSHQIDKHVVPARITLTNSPAGTTTYKTVQSQDSGDPIPTGLAYFMWCSINNVPINWADGIAAPPETPPSLDSPHFLQWEGTHIIAEDTVHSLFTPANTLNLQGGNPDWAAMNAAIYAVDYDFFKGRTVIHFGPHKHLQAAAYFQMVTIFRYRTIWNNPQLRNNGSSGAGSSNNIGDGGTPKENTTEQIPTQSIHTTESQPIDGLVTQVQHDANTNGGQVIIQTADSDGVDTTLPQVQLTQDDLGTVDDDDDTGRVAKWRKLVVFDLDGTPQQVVAAASDFETTDVSPGGTDIQWGKLNVVDGNPEIYGNYFVVNTGSVSTTCAATVETGATSFTVADTLDIEIGDVISGTSIPSGTTVTGISGSTITMSNASTGAVIDGYTYTFAGLFRVAKVAKLRFSVTSEEIDGNTFSYSFGATSPYYYVSREAVATVDDETVSEYQVIVPRFLGTSEDDADEIWFRPVDNGDIGSMVSVADSCGDAGQPIVYLDTNEDGRAWCAAADQSGWEGSD